MFCMETYSLHFGYIYRSSVTTLLSDGWPDKGGGKRGKEQAYKSFVDTVIIMVCYTGDIDLKLGSEVSVQLVDKHRAREAKLWTNGGLNWFHSKGGLKAQRLATRATCRPSGNHRSTSTLWLESMAGMLWHYQHLQIRWHVDFDNRASQKKYFKVSIPHGWLLLGYSESPWRPN